MKPFILRVLWLFSAILMSTLVTGAAGMLGRGSASPIAAVQVNTRDSDLVTYMLVDVDRRTTITRRLPVPELVDERWYAQPPLILQRETRGEFADWILSTVDVWRNTLSPVLRLTTLNNVRIRTLDFITRERAVGTTQYTVYVPHSGEIWTAAPDNPDAVLMAEVPRGLQYPLMPSPDGTMLAVNGAGELIVMNADGSEMRTFEGLQTQTWVTWSPDSRKLLASPADLYSRESARVIDIRTGEQTVLDASRMAISCGIGYIAITEEANGFGVTRISEDGASRAILDAETLNGLEPAGIIQLERQRCDWLVIVNRRGEALLVHTDSGDTMPLGNDLRIISVDDGTMLYQALAGDTIEVKRLTLASGAQPEVLWTYARTFAEIRWLDDRATRGLFIDNRRLTLVEGGQMFTVPLTDAVVEFYSLLED